MYLWSWHFTCIMHLNSYLNLQLRFPRVCQAYNQNQIPIFLQLKPLSNTLSFRSFLHLSEIYVFLINQARILGVVLNPFFFFNILYQIHHQILAVPSKSIWNSWNNMIPDICYKIILKDWLWLHTLVWVMGIKWFIILLPHFYIIHNGIFHNKKLKSNK